MNMNILTREQITLCDAFEVSPEENWARYLKLTFSLIN